MPPPEAVPFLQLGASQSVHPVQEAEPEAGDYGGYIGITKKKMKATMLGLGIRFFRVYTGVI